MRPLNLRFGHSYESTSAGIVIPVFLVHGSESVEVKAKVDTGAAFCLFDRLHGETLGLDVEAGELQRFRTVTGRFAAFGHELTLRSYTFEWTSTVYFYEDLNSHGNFLGRSGWLDRVRMGLVHHDERIYVEPYDEITQ